MYSTGLDFNITFQLWKIHLLKVFYYSLYRFFNKAVNKAVGFQM